MKKIKDIESGIKLTKGENKMRKLFLIASLAILTIVTSNAQTQGDWYIGTGEIADVSWTEWSISPTIGYGITNDLMIGTSISQADSTQDISYDLHARYFLDNYFVYVATNGLSTEGLSYGIGKQFTFHNAVYIEPKVIYNSEERTTNLRLGFGLRF